MVRHKTHTIFNNMIKTYIYDPIFSQFYFLLTDYISLIMTVSKMSVSVQVNSIYGLTVR